MEQLWSIFEVPSPSSSYQAGRRQGTWGPIAPMSQTLGVGGSWTEEEPAMGVLEKPRSEEWGSSGI